MVEKFQALIESILTAPDNNQNIFHYTNEHGYSEICRSEYLRINSHLFLNTKDETNKELHSAINLIKDKLSNHPLLKNHIYLYDKFMSRGIIYYSLSFTNQRSPFLANKYGNICLEFNALSFKQFARTSTSTLFGNVVYALDKQQEIINKIFNIFDHEPNEDNYISLFLYLSLITPLLKPNEHKTDNECRVVQAEIFAPSDSTSPENDGELFSPLVTKKAPFHLREIIKIYKE